jgi:hypothetical protein
MRAGKGVDVQTWSINGARTVARRVPRKFLLSPFLLLWLLGACQTVANTTNASEPSPTTASQPSATRAVPALGASRRDLTGYFVIDSRPKWIGYLSLTQSGSVLDGIMVSVNPDGVGGTDSKQTNVLGQTSGTDFRLNTTMLGVQRGDDIELTYPGPSGRIETLIYARASQNQFNNMLSEWQEQLKAAYLAGPCVLSVKDHDATVAVMGTQAHAWCDSLARNVTYALQRTRAEPTSTALVCTVQLSDAVARVRDTGGQNYGRDICRQLGNMAQLSPGDDWQAVQTAAQQVQALGTALANAIAEVQKQTKALAPALVQARSHLPKEQAILKTMHSHLDAMKSHAAVRPMTCYQANQTVRYDYEQTLRYDLDQSLGFERRQLSSAVSDINQLLATGEKRVAAARQAGKTLADAQRNNPYPSPALTVRPGDEEVSIGAFTQAAQSARDTVASINDEATQALAEAQSIMDQAKAVLDAARALVSC